MSSPQLTSVPSGLADSEVLAPLSDPSPKSTSLSTMSGEELVALVGERRRKRRSRQMNQALLLLITLTGVLTLIFVFA